MEYLPGSILNSISSRIRNMHFKNCDVLQDIVKDIGEFLTWKFVLEILTWFKFRFLVNNIQQTWFSFSSSFQGCESVAIYYKRKVFDSLEVDFL